MAVLSLPQLRAECADRLAGGQRMAALFGRRAGTNVVVTAVFQSPGKGLEMLRARAGERESYPSLTRDYPAAQALERELWEQTGLLPDGHPWLKPIRFEGSLLGRTDTYPFFKVRGAEVHEVGVGPIHASVIEPGHFRFMCHGERIEHLEIQLGYQHRGVEGLLLSSYHGRARLVESIAGDSSIAYTWGYCAAVEALCGHGTPFQDELVRGIALEMERIAMHLSTLSGMATDVAFLQGGATYGRLRTAIINATMRICGSRFGRGWLRPGGVRFGIDEARRADLREVLADFSRDTEEVNTLMLKSRSVRSRLKGTGILQRAQAVDLGMVGLAARACAVAADARCDLPGRLYSLHPVQAASEPDGDCWARMRVRMAEIRESVRWIEGALDAQGLGAQTGTGVLSANLAPDGLCVSVREGFRGPVVQCLETGADGLLVHYKIVDPSMLNWIGLAVAARGNEISDFPICNKSFDLSYSGNDL